MMCIVFFACFVLIQLHTARSSSATEPLCFSKFSYEEKLLEKMIRTEVKVENTQNEIKKTEETVLNTLVEIKKTALDIQDKFQGLSNDLTTKIVVQMKEMQSKEEQISNKFEELTNNITVKMDNERDIMAKLKEQFANQFEELTNNIREKMETERDILAKLKEPIIQPSVAFHVHNVKDLVLDTHHEVLVFQNIITNEGSGYDKSTGIFTAHVEGVYHFNVHACSGNKNYLPIGLVLDSKFVAKSINYDEDSYTCGSVSAIVKMKSGGQVWVANTGENNEYALHPEDRYRMNTFSGMLISK